MTSAAATPKGQIPGRGGGRKRSAARLAAVQALYQIDLTGAAVETVVAEFIKHRLERDIDGDNYGAVDRALFADIVTGASHRRQELDRMIAAALTEEWPLERLEVTLRAILRAGAYELAGRRDVPARVTLNEYMDLAHAFFAGKEPGLVNGVLDRLAKTLRPDDLEPGGGRARGA
jgi:N utilization substance protein B